MRRGAEEEVRMFVTPKVKVSHKDGIAATPRWSHRLLLKRIVGVTKRLHVRPLASCVTRSTRPFESSATFGTAIASGSTKMLGVPRTMKPR